MRKSSIFRQMYLGVSFPIDTLSNRQQFLSINIRLGIFAFGYLALRLIRFYVDMVNVCELIRIITNVLLFRFFGGHENFRTMWMNLEIAHLI